MGRAADAALNSQKSLLHYLYRQTKYLFDNGCECSESYQTSCTVVQKITSREVSDICYQPVNKLLYQTQTLHEKHFNNEIELCTLLSIKTGSCPEDYCPQNGHDNAKGGFSFPHLFD